MSFYKVCPWCGCHLDPGEICDCKEKAAVGAANTDNGKVEIGKPVQFSTSQNITSEQKTQDCDGGNKG